MSTVNQNQSDEQIALHMNFDDMPKLDDGTVDFRKLAVMLVETCINAAMELAVDELVAEGNRRNGYRERKLMTVIGVITLRIPKVREGSYFPYEVMRPYSRVDRAMIGVIAEVYKLGLSTRKIEKAAEDLEFAKLSPSAISRMLASLDEDVATLCHGEYTQPFPYLWLDATYVKCRNGSRVENTAIVSAIAAGMDGQRRYVGAAYADCESYESWKEFLLDLRKRGIEGVQLVISDAHRGLKQAIQEVFPGSSWQRCVVHLMRTVSGRMKTKEDRRKATSALSAVFKESDPALVRAAYDLAIEKIAAMDKRTGMLLEDAREDALCYLSFPQEHRLRIRTNNVQERANREIKRRTKVVQVFPSRKSLMRLVCAVLVDQNDAWLDGHFMNAAGMTNLDRDAEYPAPTEETLQVAETLIAEALRTAA